MVVIYTLNKMTLFQILTVVLSGFILLGSILAVYVRLRIDTAKIEVDMLNIRRELIQKEVSLLRLEDRNTQEHKDIVLKIERVLETINSK